MDFQKLLDTQKIFEWIAANRVGVIVGSLFVLYIGGILLVSLYRRYDFYLWYFVVFVVGLLGTFTSVRLYCYAFLLGMATAFAEIISKFRDEPIKALRTPHALLYHLLNGAVAAFALKTLVVFSGPEWIADGQAQLKSVLAAGLGSMLIMRSKLFNIKVGGEDVSFGPEQIVKIYFRFMEAAIDRFRAQDRIDFVTSKLGNIRATKVFEYAETMLLASQAFEEKAKAECLDAIKALNTGTYKDLPEKLRSYRLGFLLLDNMGEDFVTKLFEKVPPDWMFEAPIQEKLTIVDRISALPIFPSTDAAKEKEKPVLYLAYGSSMSSQKFRARLGKQWQELDEASFVEITKPRKCELSGYNLFFNGYRPGAPGNGTAAQEERTGLANIVKSSENDKVEGVLYELAKEVIEFLDRTEPGYERINITVMVQGKPFNADAYVSTIRRDNVTPDETYVQSVLAGAKEFKLSDAYVKQIEAAAKGAAV